MKTGVLTYHAGSNFGANLQALSTVGYLKKHRFDPIIINWVPKEFEKWTAQRVPTIQTEAHRLFCAKYLPMTNICRNDTDVAAEIQRNGIDNVFIGSDALWNYFPESRRKKFTIHPLRWEITSPDHDFPNPFWGVFDQPVSEISRVAFSVSCQNTPYYLVEGKLKKTIGTCLLQFKHITVRDEWTKQLVKYFTDGAVSPDITPDPVFAFNNNVETVLTKEYIQNKYRLNDKYILASFLHPKFDAVWAKEFEKLCNADGYQCVAFPFPEKLLSFDFDSKIELPLDPLEWYYLIKYSSGYVGERMHPIVVSLHNAVPFFCYDNYGVEHRSRWLKYIIPATPNQIQKSIQSSKTFDIVQKAGFLDNYYNYNSQTLLPSPSEVYEKLVNFDSVKCKIFADTMTYNYNKSMNFILSKS
ncbi:hypothetical protein FACS189432_02430 [Bacteroidia bacterium]|nr:hypothetical protein FACS189426_00490 [Bacteroidia bacterium]GHT26962.1 hypothetical protein FACS189432_02430 [Bacteroidia bacterium]